VVISPRLGTAEQTGASEVIKTFNSGLIKSMKAADKLGFQGRYNILEKVMKDSFALSFMARKAVGRYWRTLTSEQKRLFVDTYSEWSISSYAGRFDNYNGEIFKLISEEKASRGTVTVTSLLVKTAKEPVEFQYKLRETDGKWRIVDIHISGVSQLALTRSQFISVLKKGSFYELMAKLQMKINELSRGN
jgi:phospholipid transport system substrate-binding protein